MDKVLEIASSVSTPLGLGGLFAAIVFFLFKEVLQKNIFPPLSRALGSQVITLIIERLFVLALVAMSLGFVGYLVSLLVPSVVAQPGGKHLPVVYRTCRHPDFGQVGWVRSETVTQSSGHRDGGSNPQNWCNELSNSFIQGRSIGAQHAVEVLKTSESHDKDWLGHVTYNYTCSLKISWEPLYAEKQDPRCGVTQ